MITAFLGFFGLMESMLIIVNGIAKARKTTLDIRLQSIADEAPQRIVTRLKKGAYSENETIDKILKNLKQLDFLENLLRQAGSKYSVGKLLIAMGVAGLLVFITALLLGFGVLLSLLFGVAGIFLPAAILLYRKKRRMTAIESQLPDILDMLSRAMRAGHSFSTALKMAGNEGPEPIATEFRITSDEINFGSSVREGIMRLAERIDSMDMRFFALSVMIQAETGGNLSGLLSDLARLIRERLKLKGQVRVLAAEGRLSAIILGSLPFLFGLVMTVFKPDYISFFWHDPKGPGLIKVVAVMMVVGLYWINKITTIRV
jgi:tight adherence protein B